MRASKRRMRLGYTSKSQTLLTKHHAFSAQVLHLPELCLRTGNSQGVADRFAAISDTLSHQYYFQ